MTAPVLLHGDALEKLREMPADSVDAIVTDPPYGLSFMGKRWDYDVPSVEVWAECLRVLKPGGHLLAFAGTRTQHRMAVRIEDAGFEIRDMIAWVYGSGFPKSLDVSKAIDKAAGSERPLVERIRWDGKGAGQTCSGFVGGSTSPQLKRDDAPATEAAQQWQGWGTALKPALEPITVARKPLVGTVAANVLAHGTGALNIDGCRVNSGPVEIHTRTENVTQASSMAGVSTGSTGTGKFNTGRWPANLIHDGSDDVLAGFPDSEARNGGRTGENGGYGGAWKDVTTPTYKDTGSAARFFYCAKASKKDRDEGLEGMPKQDVYSEAAATPMRDQRQQTQRANIHPTVKPTDLMRYLCRLVTPPCGVVLDPFMGSGSTGKAALLEGLAFIGVEREADYLEIARARIAAARAFKPQSDFFG